MFKKLYRIKFIFLLFASLGFPNVNGETITIRGTVLDSDSVTLPGVAVVINHGDYGTATDRDGAFLFEDLPVATYHLTAQMVGFRTYSQTIEADGGSTLDITIVLEEDEFELHEVRVTGFRQEVLSRGESVSVRVVDADFLGSGRSGSLMQTLETLPGVHSMNIGSGVSKPVIRGLGYYRVVFANNGIKQAGQHWSSHTGLSVDQSNIHHLEVIMGPASLRFGSDAIGGVINTLPPDIPEAERVTGHLSFTGKSNTGWLGGSARLSARSGDFYFHTNITHNNFGDFQVPYTDVFLLPAPVSSAEASHEVELGDHVPNTAGRENALAFTAGLNRSWGNSYLDFSFHQSKTGFFDWVGLMRESTRLEHEESNRDIRIPYQIVDNYAIYHYTNAVFDKSRLQLAFGYQYNVSSEHSPLFDRTGNRIEELRYFRDNRDNLELELTLHNFTANAVYSLRQFVNQRFDLVVNTGYETNLTDGYSHILPEYDRISAGAGIIHQINISPRWLINSGLRFDLHHFEMEESVNPDPEYGDPVFNEHYRKLFTGTGFSFGVNYLPDPLTVMKINIGKSYRIPSAYELGAYGLHRHEGRFERGDTDIDPEESYQLDLSLDRSWEDMTLSISPFVNYFTNYLFLNPSPELRPEGQVYEYQQTDALLYGGEFSLERLFYDRIRVSAAAEYVYAINLDGMRALPFIPPLSVLSKVTYFFNNSGVVNNTRLCAKGRIAAAQRLTVPNELDTPGYAVLNLSLCTDVAIGNQQAEVSFRVNNLLDARYFNHVSFYRRMRIPEPGRDFQLHFTIPF